MIQRLYHDTEDVSTDIATTVNPVIYAAKKIMGFDSFE